MLKPLGFNVRQIAQEHSYVPHMWQRIGKPDVLIFLDVSFEISQERKKLNWNRTDFDIQQQRLIHAKSHADFYLLTDKLTCQQVFAVVIEFLNNHLGKG